jgi:hypothetical protein
MPLWTESGLFKYQLNEWKRKVPGIILQAF